MCEDEEWINEHWAEKGNRKGKEAQEDERNKGIICQSVEEKKETCSVCAHLTLYIQCKISFKTY